jgi:hypothetical protein
MKDGEHCGTSRQSQGYQPLNEIHQTSQLAFCVWAPPNTYRENECQHIYCSWIPVPAVKLRHICSQYFPRTNQFTTHTRLLIVIRHYIIPAIITTSFKKRIQQDREVFHDGRILNTCRMSARGLCVKKSKSIHRLRDVRPFPIINVNTMRKA